MEYTVWSVLYGVYYAIGKVMNPFGKSMILQYFIQKYDFEKAMNTF